MLSLLDAPCVSQCEGGFFMHQARNSRRIAKRLKRHRRPRSAETFSPYFAGSSGRMMNVDLPDPLSGASVEALLRDCRRRPDALGELLEHYRAGLSLAARAHLDPQTAARIDAADIVQETLARALAGFQGFEGTSEPEFSAWLARILQLVVTDVTREHVVARKRSVLREVGRLDSDGSTSIAWYQPATDDTSPSWKLIRGEQALRLAELLVSLPERQWKALQLRYMAGASIREVASELNTTLAGAGGLIRRGLAALRERVTGESWL